MFGACPLVETFFPGTLFKGVFGFSLIQPRAISENCFHLGVTFPSLYNAGYLASDQGQRLPQTMRLYGTMGTPEIAIIDKKGVIRFQEFGGFRPEGAQVLIRRLL